MRPAAEGDAARSPPHPFVRTFADAGDAGEEEADEVRSGPSGASTGRQAARGAPMQLSKEEDAEEPEDADETSDGDAAERGKSGSRTSLN